MCFSFSVFIHSTYLILQFSKYFCLIIDHVSFVALYNLYAHTAFMAVQYDLKYIIFKPPSSIGQICTALAISSLLFFHKKLKKSLLVSFINFSGIPIADSR